MPWADDLRRGWHLRVDLFAGKINTRLQEAGRNSVANDP
jgi:hypothetical protein